MKRFFFVFSITLIISFFSMLLATVAGGILFFGKQAPFPSPETVPYTVARLVIVAINLFPGILFIRRQVKGHSESSAWILWFGGLLALGIIGMLSLGLSSFSVN